MGNCTMSRRRVKAQEEIERHPEVLESPTAPMNKKQEEKRVRFRTDDRDEDMHDGVVRIRVVVTKEELKRILSGSDRSDELLSALRLRSRSIVVSNGARDDNDEDCWRPALESIPEDH